MKLYILCGLPFSGKTSLAKKIAEYTGAKLIAFDQLWLELGKDTNVAPLLKGDEGWRLIRSVAKERIAENLKNSRSVVYDDINVKREHREELREVARKHGAIAIVVYVDTPLAIREEREKENLFTKRRHDVEPVNSKKALAQFEEPGPPEQVIVFFSENNLEEWSEEL
ncbi:MAG: ATP-binding protein [Patescibacteria group bacterium]